MLIYKKPRPHGCILNIPLISFTTNKKQTIAYWARLLIIYSSEIIPLNSDTSLRSQLKNSCFRGSNHLETTKALRPRRRALIRFLVFGTPDKKLAFVFDLLLQTPENWNDINLRLYLLQLEHGRQENSLKPATHLDILYADRGEFGRQRFSPPIDVDTPSDFFRGDVAVLKTHAIKSPNLMGWLYWRFAAINVENRRNGHTWRMSVNLIDDIWHARYRRFYTPIAAIGV